MTLRHIRRNAVVDRTPLTHLLLRSAVTVKRCGDKPSTTRNASSTLDRAGYNSLSLANATACIISLKSSASHNRASGERARKAASRTASASALVSLTRDLTGAP
jgi:hypothetical protein